MNRRVIFKTFNTRRSNLIQDQIVKSQKQKSQVPVDKVFSSFLASLFHIDFTWKMNTG